MILRKPIHSSRQTRPVEKSAAAGMDGFTLLELMIVMGLAVMLMVLAGPSLASTLRGSQLTQAGQLVGDQLSLAQQTSLAKNHAVEVRFYQFPDTAGTPYYRAMQSFEILPSGSAVPLTKAQLLPSTIIIDSGLLLSPLIAKAAPLSQVPTASSGNELHFRIPGAGLAYQSASFRFRPDGTTELPAGAKWFVTLHSQNNGDQLPKAPANYVTLQIDPTNGHVHTFRP